ncbi:MAG TPA: PLD nuclease N-terminal domain-containing protein [Thermomicrobiales bacterium]|nr:PLD nuclease N-terminal domain-containing protein [Thermomicrobiales bacterium]
MSPIADTLGASTSAAAAILALAVVQLAIQIYALVDLARRRQVAGGKRWVWLVVILFGNLVGAILYLVIGRATPPAAEPEPGAGASPGDRARAAADLLYGPDERR